jgi:3-isopropylmalate/(R)-2-methylmalate dehydratase small subunit
MATPICGKVFVVGDNIDTDQIIPAQYLALVPTIPEEYAKLGTHALSGLPDSFPRLVPEGATGSPYAVVVAGRNFGCGSSREHAPISLGAAGVAAVVAESYARIFFRNCIATGELYPVETETRLCEVLKTGDTVEIDLDAGTLKGPAGTVYSLRSLGDARAVIDQGGLFEYARGTGMIR